MVCFPLVISGLAVVCPVACLGGLLHSIRVVLLWLVPMDGGEPIWQAGRVAT